MNSPLDEIIPASPTSVRLKFNLKNREHRKRKRKVKKHSSTSEQQPLSNIINVDFTSAPASFLPCPQLSLPSAAIVTTLKTPTSKLVSTVSSNTVPLTSVPSIAPVFTDVPSSSKEPILLHLSTMHKPHKVNINLYGDDDINDTPVAHNLDILASAKLLEKAKYSHNARQPTFSKSQLTTGLVQLSNLIETETSPKCSSPTIDTESFMTNTQWNHICEAADNAKDLHLVSNRLKEAEQPESSRADIFGKKTPLKRNLLKQSILDDFDVNSPSPKRNKPNAPQTPSPRLKTTVIRTYSRRKLKEEKPTTSRRLFEIPDSPSTVHSNFSDESDLEADAFATCTSRPQMVSSPDFDLNQSVIENIHNLSFYYSQPDVSNSSEHQHLLEEIFCHISRLKSCVVMQSPNQYENAAESELSEDSFQGFGEATTITPNLVFNDHDNDSYPHKQEAHLRDVCEQFTDSDEFFANFKSPQKPDTQAAALPKPEKSVRNLLSLRSRRSLRKSSKTQSNHPATSDQNMDDLINAPLLTDSCMLPGILELNAVGNVQSPLTSFGGFATGRGAPLKVTETAIKKSAQIFTDILEKKDNVPCNTVPPPCLGFKTAKSSTIRVANEASTSACSFIDSQLKDIPNILSSDNKLTAEQEAYTTLAKTDPRKKKKTLEMFDQFIDDLFNEPTLDQPDPFLLPALQTAKGSGVDENKPDIDKATPLEIVTTSFTSFGGFTTGRNVLGKISENSKMSAEMITNILKKKNDNNVSVNNVQHAMKVTAVATTSANIPFKDEKLVSDKKACTTLAYTNPSKKQKTLQTFDQFMDDLFIAPLLDQPDPFLLPTKPPANGTGLNISADGNKSTIEKSNPVENLTFPSFGGFSTGRGAPVKVSENAIKKSALMFTDILESKDEIIFPVNNVPKECSSSFKGFTTASGLGIKISDAAINKSRQIFDTVNKEFETYLGPAQTPVNKTVIRSMAFKTPGQSPLTNACTPKNQISMSQEIIESTKAVMEDDMSCEAQYNLETNFSTSLKPRKLLLNVRPTRLTARFDAADSVDTGLSIAQTTSIPFEVTHEVKMARKAALERQLQQLNLKENIRSKPGKLFIKKLTANKLKWKLFVENSIPKQSDAANLIKREVLHLSPANVAAFKFKMWEHYSYEMCEVNTDGILLDDGISVIMDDRCEIGRNEIVAAFLTCPTVDPKWLHDKWIEHHLSLILIKLAGMERSFPHKFGKRALNPENVVQQLKYRYDHEIDRAERSIIRKILEMDDVPSKRMVLYVSQIFSDNELELCDGHYVLRALMDIDLQKMICKKRLVIGTKIMVQGAELIGLDEGCFPLEVPDHVRLKIYANSTRRAKWDTQLGVYRNPNPFVITLNSVQPNGGKIARLAVHILRIYPMLYVDKGKKEGSDTVLRSERVQQRYEASCNQQFCNIENIYNQVAKDVEQDEKRKKCKTGKRKISQISDVEELYEAVKYDNDPDAILTEMTIAQRNCLYEYQAVVAAKRSEEISLRVREQLSLENKAKGKVTPMLKLKIIDAKLPDITATLSIWNPSESVIEMLKEKSSIEVENSSACGIRYNELQLSAGKYTLFKTMPTKVVSPRVESFLRRVVTLLDINKGNFKPNFNEIDTIGLIVHIGQGVPKKFQPVYIVDDKRNMLCINFWAGLKAYAYEDLVTVGRILFVKDLQWRLVSTSNIIPCSFATEFTVFTEKPKSAQTIELIQELKNGLQAHNLTEYIEECVAYIEKCKPSRTGTSITPLLSKMSGDKTPIAGTVRQSMSMELLRTPNEFSPGVGQPVSQVQSRIDKLCIYGPPPPISPLMHNKCHPSARKSFKMPKMNDNSRSEMNDDNTSNASTTLNK